MPNAQEVGPRALEVVVDIVVRGTEAVLAYKPWRFVVEIGVRKVI